MTVYSARAVSVVPVPRDNAVATGTGQHRVKMFGSFVVMKRSSRCWICKCDEDRTFIEEHLFVGHHPAFIMDNLPESSKVLQTKDGRRAADNAIFGRFASHIDGHHSNIEAEAGRRLQEYWYKQSGIEGAGVSIITARGFAEETLMETYKALKKGVIAPTMSDGLNVMKFISTMEEKSGSSHAQVFEDAIAAIFDELQRNLDPGTVGWLVQSMEARPEIKAAVKALDESKQSDEQRALAS